MADENVVKHTRILDFIERMPYATALYSGTGTPIFANAVFLETFSNQRERPSLEKGEIEIFVQQQKHLCRVREMHFGPERFFIETIEPQAKPSENTQTEIELVNIIESLRDGIYIADENGFTLHINQKYSEMTGIQKEEVIGHHVSELMYKGLFDDSITLKVLENKKPVSILQKTKEGNQIWLVTGNPIFNDAGRITKIFNTVYDMTELNQLRESLKRKEATNQNQRVELQKLREKMAEVPGLIGNSEPIRKIKTVVKKVASINSAILIEGETGSGKNVIARAIHDLSHRAGKPFIEVNCGALPEHLIETELFGYASGAFTGATKGGKKGLLEVADKGTLFLDEIGEMPLHLQVKLLTFLQDQKVRRVGEAHPIQVDIRIIAATNKDLQTLIAEEKFREDLYYRLSVIPLKLPALRDHKEDVYLLINEFLRSFNEKHKTHVKLAKSAYLALETYHWPGNVRELRHIIEQLVVLADNELVTIHDLPEHFATPRENVVDFHDSSKTLPEIVQSVEVQLIQEAWRDLKDMKLVAERLGVHRTTLLRKMEKAGVKLGEG